MVNCLANFRAQSSFTKQQEELQIKKKEFLLCNKRKIDVKPTITNIQFSQKHYLENFKISDHKYPL